MSQTTMRADLLETLQVFTELAVNTVREDLAVLSIHNVSLSVQKPRWDLVLCGILNDCDNALELF